MAYTFRTTDTDYSGDNLYVKILPLDTGTWATGIVVLTEQGTTGSFSATLDEAAEYVIYRRAGASAASTDVSVGQIGKEIASAVDNVPTAAEIVSGIRDDSAPYSPSNINLTRKIGSIQPIYIAWATTGATITGTKSINGDPSSAIVGSIVEMSPQPDWDIPVGQFWYELEYDVDDRVLESAIVEYELTDGSESQTIAVAIVR